MDEFHWCKDDIPIPNAHQRRFPFMIRVRRVCFEEILLFPVNPDDRRQTFGSDDFFNGGNNDAANDAVAKIGYDQSQFSNTEQNVELRQTEPSSLVPVMHPKELPKLTILFDRESTFQNIKTPFISVKSKFEEIEDAEQLVPVLKRPRYSIECSKAADTITDAHKLISTNELQGEFTSISKKSFDVYDESFSKAQILDKLDSNTGIKIPMSILEFVFLKEQISTNAPDEGSLMPKIDVKIEPEKPLELVKFGTLGEQIEELESLGDHEFCSLEEFYPNVSDTTNIEGLRMSKVDEEHNLISIYEDSSEKKLESQSDEELVQFQNEDSNELGETYNILDNSPESNQGIQTLEADLQLTDSSGPRKSDCETPSDNQCSIEEVEECVIFVAASDEKIFEENVITTASSSADIASEQPPDEQRVPCELDLNETSSSSFPASGYDFEDMYAAELDRAAEEKTAKIENIADICETKYPQYVPSVVVRDNGHPVKISDSTQTITSRASTMRLGLSRKQPVQPLHNLKRVEHY